MPAPCSVALFLILVPSRRPSPDKALLLRASQRRCSRAPCQPNADVARSTEAQRTLVLSTSFKPEAPRFDIDVMRRSIETNRAWSAALAEANCELPDRHDGNSTKDQQRRTHFGRGGRDNLGISP